MFHLLTLLLCIFVPSGLVDGKEHGMYRNLLTAFTVFIAGQAYAASDQSSDQGATLASFAEDTGEVIRIESAENLRTYTQEVAAAACTFTTGSTTPSAASCCVRRAMASS